MQYVKFYALLGDISPEEIYDLIVTFKILATEDRNSLLLGENMVMEGAIPEDLFIEFSKHVSFAYRFRFAAEEIP